MIILYGASDDLIEIEGEHVDEIDCYDCTVTFTIGNREASPGQNAAGVVVRLEYAPTWHPGAVWVATVAPIDEGCEIPWPVTVSAEGYSARVRIDCPPGTPIEAAKANGKRNTVVWRDGKAVGEAET